MSAVAPAHDLHAPDPTTVGEETLPARVAPLARQSLIVGVVGLVAWAVFALVAPSAFPAYLVAYTFFVGIGVGSLGFLMLHHLVGGAWGFAIRRPLEAAAWTLPGMAVLFLPIAVGARSLYEWALPDAAEAHHAIGLKAGYLNLPFFYTRAVLYLAIWIGLAFLMRRNSEAQDRTENAAPTRRNQRLAAPGLILVFVSITFAGIDWLMSIEPEWYSSIYGVTVMIGWGLTALSVGVITASRLANVRPLAPLANANAFNDLGNLLLAFTMLWAYMSFSQFLLIWSGNLTEEIPYYLRRSKGGWQFVCALLMLVHFFVPFFCLLIRENKRSVTRLWRVAALLIAVHFLNDVWLVIPAYDQYPHWLSVLALVPATAGVGGLWLASYLRNLTARSLVPKYDPLLAQVLEHHHAGGH